MQKDKSDVNFHEFVDNKLSEKGFRIIPVTEELMKKRLNEFMDFVNSIRLEHKDIYGWSAESKEYFLNGLNDKWKYSYTILDNRGEICFVNLTSVYGDILHTHCSYARKDKRNFGLAMFHFLKLCHKGIENGFSFLDGFWPKNNNGSIILYLRMGLEIQDMRNNKELRLMADLRKVRNRIYNLLIQAENKML